MGRRGDALTTSAVHRRIASLGKQAEIDGDVSPHTLRHTLAKNLINAGEGIEKVAALLGHSNLNTTRLYITPSEQDLRLSVSKLD